jgi:hypothetical protein
MIRYLRLERTVAREAYRMKHARYLLVTLLCISLLLPILITNSSKNDVSLGEIESNLGLKDNVKVKDDGFSISEEATNGVLNPVSIVEYGVSQTINMTGNTDQQLTEAENLTINTLDGWVAKEAQIEVYDVHKNYAYNGSFDDGFAPWVNSTYDASGGSQIQIANHDVSGGYITAINYGQLKTHPIAGDSYIHHAGSEIVWSQTIDNSPFSDSFLLSFDFRYVSGPLDFAPYDFSGDVVLGIFVNGGAEGYIYIASGDISTRNTWYSITDYQVDIPGAPGSFKLELGMYIVTQDIELQESGDYDDDGYPDGLVNAQKIELNFDNIEFVSTLTLDCPDVDMVFHIEELNSTITGLGQPGTATITNENYWATDLLEVRVTTNASVSFDYNVKLELERLSNSSWTSDPNKQGVTYSVMSSESVELSLFTYVSAPYYENSSIVIYYPWDWENVTIRDPLLNDVTSQCIVSSGQIEIPESLMDKQGWWKITLDALNYLKNMSTEVYDTGFWYDNSVFRSNNISRLEFELGTAASTPLAGDSQVNITWRLPNSTIWNQDVTTSWSGGIGYSDQHTLGALNTTAGQWSIDLIWINGSEIAFSSILFDVYHAASLTPVQTIVETDVGLIITNLLHYIDSDTSEYLMDDSATIEGNWSSSIVSFAPNLIRNWWEADFDTSDTGGGEFTVVVNASREYYDFASCSFTILATYTTTLNIYNSTATAPFNTEHILKFNYKYTNGTGIQNAQTALTYSGTAGGLSPGSLEETSPGEYEIAVKGLEAGVYTITLNGSKLYHQYATDSLILTIEEVNTDLTVINGTTGITSAGSSYRVVITYTNSTGYGLENATIIVESTLPATGITAEETEELGNGQYAILLSPDNVAIYNIVFKANISNHVTSYAAFALTATQVPTTLELAVSTATIGVTESYVIVMQLNDESLQGVDNAVITIVDPPVGLFFHPQENHTNGNYSIQIDALQYGTYLITISASTPNYQDSIDSFTLIVDEISTKFQIINGSADFVGFNEEYNLVVRYTTASGTGLDGADIQIVNVTPGTGLLYGSFQPELNGYYSILVQPTQATVFTILIQANLTNHQVQYGTFTLTVREISTILHLNVTSTSISVADSLTIGVTFTNLAGIGIPGADIEISNPPSGLSFINHEDHLNGNYSFQLVPNKVGSYLITIIATLENYQDGFSSFSVVIDQINTELVRLNGSSDFVRIGESYRLVLRYQNNTDGGLFGATVVIADINPEEGLEYGNATYSNDGYYAILLTPSLARTYTLAIRANLTNHVTQIVTFTLTVSEIPTILTIDRASATISVDKEYLVELYFTDDDTNPLENATIIILDPPEGIYYEVEDMTGGYYHVLINPSTIGTSQIAFRAKLTNYQNSTVGFTLNVRVIPTTLIRVGSELRESILFKEYYELSLLYIRTDTDENISLAEIDIQASPEYGILWNVVEVEEFYVVFITTNTTGTWNLYITANKSQYVSADTQFRLDVTAIETDINEFTLLEPLVYGRLYNFTFEYLMFNETRVSQANIQYSGSAAPWSSHLELSDGRYRLSISPQSTGDYEVILYFTRDGFQDRSSRLSFSVIPVSVSVTDIQGLSGLEGQPNVLSLRLVETGTNNPVTGVLVQYQFVSETSIGELNVLEENPAGTYSGTIIMPSADSNTKLRIYIDSEYYEMAAGYVDEELTPTESALSIVTRTFTRYFPLWIGIGAVVVALGGRRVYNKRKREQNLKALEIKRRFDDINSVLGVLVIHKNSGIPLYSKIVKGGINEILISGFISAITQFRGEFDVDQENFVITPISDIIRAVATENLICAFITLTSPSQTLEKKMLQYAETVGFVFDHQFTEAPMKVLDNGAMTQFDILFDEVLDGILIQRYRIQDVKGLPRKPKCVEREVADIAKSDAFTLNELATRMTGCGVEESYAYLSIWEAIEKKQIQMVDLGRFEPDTVEDDVSELE